MSRCKTPAPVPNAPKSLKKDYDVRRYLTTVTRMLHNDQITPQKANALVNVCNAMIAADRGIAGTGAVVQINVGGDLPGSGKTVEIKEVKTEQPGETDND